jgi:hypothetical protein
MWANVFDACKMFTFIGMDPLLLKVIDQCFDQCLMLAIYVPIIDKKWMSTSQ